MQNVSGYSEDGEPSGEPKMVFPDGEVLTFVRKGKVVHVIIEWIDFNKRDSVMKSYRFTVDPIKLTHEKVGVLNPI